MRAVPMDESTDQQQPQPEPLNNTMQPLDISDLAVTWPIWQQQFKIYLLAIHDQVSDRRKLAIFLNCLGPAGIALATKFVPELKDIDSVPDEISFDQLWSLFGDLCSKAKPTSGSFQQSFHFYNNIWQLGDNLSDAYPDVLYGANKCDFRCHVCQTSYTERIARDQLMLLIPEQEHIMRKDLLKLNNPTSQELISKYNDIQKDRKMWTLVFPYLTLCDMEALSLSSPAMDHIVQWFIETIGQVQIKQCCLDRFCPQSSPEFYQKYGEYVRDLRLNNIQESDVQRVIHFFKCVDYFALQDMQILDSVEGFPNELMALKLINSTMELPLMKEWLQESHHTLDSLEVVNFVYSFYASTSSEKVQDLNLTPFRHLKKLIIKGDVVNASTSDYDIPCRLEFLKLSARNLCQSSFNCPKLRHLHYDVDEVSHVFWGFKDATSTLVSLTLKKWLPIQPVRFSEFEALEKLEITTPVPLRYKSDIESLNIRTKIVEYESIPDIPEEPNLIFDMLNEYCILEIMDYLSVPDWMIFAQLHPIAERAAGSYKYPRHPLKSEECSDSKIYLNLEHFLYICERVKSYTIDLNDQNEMVLYFHLASMMPALKSLTVDVTEIPQELVQFLPGGLEKLVFKWIPKIDLTAYFRRLAPTLRSLEIRLREGHEKGLLELTNLRELRTSACKISIPIFAKFLRLNSDTLEYLKVTLNGSPESGWVPYKKVLQTIGSMRNLKVLKINRVFIDYDSPSVGVEGSCYLVGNLFKKIGPQLKKLSIDVNEEQMVEVLGSEELRNIQDINIMFSPPVARESILALVSTMTNLRKLTMTFFWRHARERDLKRNLEVPELMSLLEALPLLTQLKPDYNYEATIKFRMDLKEYLRQKNRELWIHGAKI